MEENESKFVLNKYNAFSREIKQYIRLIESKQSDSLCKLKKTLFNKINKYGDPELDFLKEFIKTGSEK